MDIQWIGCNPANYRSGRPVPFKPEAIVIHISTGSLESADMWFNDPQAQVSAHYIVAKSGIIHQFVKETDTAFHAGTVVNPSWPLIKPKVNPNYYTIGIEHEGQAADIWPNKIQTSAGLVAAIAARWNIPLDARHVIGHHEIRASKPCPGTFITTAKILASIPNPVSNSIVETPAAGSQHG